MLLQEKKVIISGGAGLIGSALARGIIDHGAGVLLLDVNEERGKTLESELGSNALFVLSDTADPKSVDNAIEIGNRKFGDFDAAVHCAYPRSAQWGTIFENLEAESLKNDLFSQLGGTILFSQRMIRYFRNEKKGNLVLLSSIQGTTAPKFDHYIGTGMVSPIEYSAIKAGVISVTKYLAKYLKNENIRVNCISPGGILDAQPESFLKKYRESCNSKGMLDADDLTGTLVYLLSDYSSYVTGQNLIVDDGWSL